MEQITATGYEGSLNPMRVRADGSLEGIPLEDLVMAQRRFPERFVVGFCPHPLLGNPAARLRSAAGIFNVKVCGEWKFQLPIDDPRCIETFRVAGELGLPVVLHLDVPYLPDGNGGTCYDPSWYGGTVENLERALTACPETVFIGHAPGFWRELSADADCQTAKYPEGPLEVPGRLQRLLDKHANLWADLSAGSACAALKRDPEYAKKFICGYASKLLFARDYYGGDLLELLRSLHLPDDVWVRIGRENAERLVAPPARSFAR